MKGRPGLQTKGGHPTEAEPWTFLHLWYKCWENSSGFPQGLGKEFMYSYTKSAYKNAQNTVALNKYQAFYALMLPGLEAWEEEKAGNQNLINWVF